MFTAPRSHRSVIVAAALAALAAGTASAAPGALAIRGAWVRPAAAGMNAAGYLTVVNGGRAPDRLVSASSPAAARVTMHESRMVGSMMTMRALPDVAIPAAGAVTFKPGGLHLMFEGLAAPLKTGDSVAVTLVFGRAGRRSARLVVRNTAPGAM